MVRRPLLGAIDVAVSVFLLIGVWIALPARWWLVDWGGSFIAAAFFVSGLGLVIGTPWARRVGLAVGVVVAALGAITVTTLASTAGYLAGLYGPVGRGGALILGVVAVLVLPYLVFLPLAQAYALARASER